MASLEWLYTSTGAVVCDGGRLSGVGTEALPRRLAYGAVYWGLVDAHYDIIAVFAMRSTLFSRML